MTLDQLTRRCKTTRYDFFKTDLGHLKSSTTGNASVSVVSPNPEALLALDATNEAQVATLFLNDFLLFNFADILAALLPILIPLLAIADAVGPISRPLGGPSANTGSLAGLAWSSSFAGTSCYGPFAKPWPITQIRPLSWSAGEVPPAGPLACSRPFSTTQPGWHLNCARSIL